jgi:hypothetical protein
MDGQPSTPGIGPARPTAGWHETAATLTGRDGDGPAAVRVLLEHASVGLLCQPAAASSAAQLVRLLTGQAVAELAEAGVSCPPPATAGTGIDRVHLADVRPLLAAAATRLAGCTGDNEMDLLAYARAALLAREALDAATGG